MAPRPPTPATATSNSQPPAARSGAQAVMVAGLTVLVILLSVRAYGNRIGARPTEPAAVDLIDLNTADQHELAQVPGVGPKLAEAIADHRRVYGPFRSVDELRNVRGVGPVTFEKIRDQFRASALQLPSDQDAPPSPRPPPATQPGSAAAKIQPGEPPINLNTATAEELQRLPDIGPVKASAILAARKAKAFESVHDLEKVKGIGPKTMDKLRPFIVVE